MRIVRVLVLFFILSIGQVAGQSSNNINAQWKWAKLIGGSSNDFATDASSDYADNLYGIGIFTNSIDIVGQTLSMAGVNSYMVKLDSLGTKKWALAFPGSLLKISIDPNNSNNIIIAGVFSGSITVGSISLNSAGSTDCYAIKTDSLGNIIWVTSWGGNGNDKLADLEYQVDGNVIAIGNFKSDVLFFPDTISVNKIYDSSLVNNNTRQNLYSSKFLNNTGKAAWAFAKGQVGINLNIDLSADMRGNIGLSYGNGYANPYSFFRYDSSFQNSELIGTINNFTSGPPSQPPEYHNVSFRGGNSRIDKFGNLFFDHSWEWQDTYGQCIGCLNADETIISRNTNTGLPFKKIDTWCTQCSVSYPILYPIGIQSDQVVLSSHHLYIVNDGKFQIDLGGATEVSSSMNLTTTRVYTTGRAQFSGGSVPRISIGSTQQPAFGGADIFLAAIGVPGIPLKADAGIDRTICAGTIGVYLGGYPSASGGGRLPFTYSWAPATGLNNPSSPYPLANPSVNTEFILTVTDGNGQVARDTVWVNIGQTAAYITPASTATFCQGDSVLLTANPGRSYLWNTGSTARYIYAKTAGIYSVTVTDECGNSSVSPSVSVTGLTIPAAPVITASGPTTFCSGGSVTLTAPAGYSYQWNNNATSQSIVVTSSGPYYVIVTNSNGCSRESNWVNVTVRPSTTDNLSITVFNNNPTTFCQGGTIQLQAPAGFTYLWSTGSTSSLLNVNSSGNYSVTVTSPYGCGSPTSIGPVVVNVLPRPPAPVISTSGPTSFCAPGQVTLSAPPGFPQYLWLGHFIIDTISFAQSIVVDSTAPRVLKVFGANGCESPTSVVQVVEHIPLVGPIPIIVQGPLVRCQEWTTITRLSAPYVEGASYLWSNGATTQGIIVNTTGNYSVTITNTCNAASSNPISVTANPTPSSTITASGPLVLCSGGAVTLSAPTGPGYTYFWARNSSQISTNQSIVVTTSGTYSVSVHSAENCVSNSQVVVTSGSNPSIPAINASGPLTFCQGGSVTLTAPAGFSYLWSSGATSQSINVTSSGNYSVTVTNASSCSATSLATNVTVNSIPAIPTITASGPTTFCQGGSVTLSAPTGFSYLWNTGATSNSINVNSSGSYSVTVTNAGNCSTSSASTSITVLAIPGVPIITASGPTTFCQGGSVTLSAPAGFNYLWNTGATTQSINVTTSGNYSVSVTNANNCSATSSNTSVTVNALPAIPAISASGPTTFCQGNSVTLFAPAGFNYLWNTGATTQSINVTTSGNYSVTVTNANNCSASSSNTTVTVNALPAIPTITASGPTTFCQGGSVTLSAPAGFAYLWNTGATIQSINVSASGNYSVTVTNANSCSSSSATTAVTVNSLPPIPIITASGPTTFCQGGSVILSAPVGFVYLWSTGAPAQSISVSATGNYNVRVTNANGCSSNSASTTVTVNPLPATPTITQNGNTLTSSPATTYQWYYNGVIITGATSQSYTYTNGGDFTVTVTNAPGCSATSAVYTAMRRELVTIGNNERFSFNLFPNPVTTQLQITYQIEQTHSVGISLVNMQGRRIPIQNPVQRSAGSYSVNANALAERIWTGVYILEFTIDGQRVTRTIVKF